MLYCGICYSVHFPGQCRATAKYASQVYSNVDVYERLPDPQEAELKLCRPCSASDRVEGHVHACQGKGCECPLCRDIVPLLAELNKEWDQIERWGL